MNRPLRHCLILLLLMMQGYFSVAANKGNLDSLVRILSARPPGFERDSQLLPAMNNLAWAMKFRNPDSSIIINQKAMQLLEEALMDKHLNWRRRIFLINARGYINDHLGVFHTIKSDLGKAIKYYDTATENYYMALGMMSENGLDTLTDEDAIAIRSSITSTTCNLGVAYKKMGNFTASLNHYFYAVKRFEQTRDSIRMAVTYGNIANIYRIQQDYKKALKYARLSVYYDSLLNRKYGLATNLGNVGLIYKNINRDDAALHYYYRAAAIDSAEDIKTHLASILGNIGGVYQSHGDDSAALYYYAGSIGLYEELDIKDGLCSTYSNIGKLYLDKAENADIKSDRIRWAAVAGHYLRKAYDIADSAFLTDYKKIQCKYLADLYHLTGDYRAAYQMLAEYDILKDSLFNKEKSMEIGKLEAQSEYEKQRLLDESEQKKKDLLAAGRDRQQKLIIYSVSLLLLLMAFFALFLYKRWRLTQQQRNIINDQKLLVDAQKQDIVDSINYARRIQNALLPSDEKIKAFFPESFIVYKPKDIVAGDFYWLQPLSYDETGKESPQKIALAAADCTGHGVPGAMVSVVCHNALNRSVREHGLSDPGKILDQSRKLVVAEFEKSEEDVKDGMDISLCTISLPNVEGAGRGLLQWAGANNPLCIIPPGTETEDDIIMLRPDKQPVGRYARERPFTTHEQKVEQGSMIYLFTDGFADQFGGERMKKLKLRPFLRLLLSHSKHPAAEQQQRLNAFFNDWKGDLDQIDDVCVLGVRL